MILIVALLTPKINFIPRYTYNYKNKEIGNNSDINLLCKTLFLFSMIPKKSRYAMIEIWKDFEWQRL